MRVTFILLRAVGAVVVAAAIVGQFFYSIEWRAENGIPENGIPIINFFSYFTIDSNIATVVVLVTGAILLWRGGGSDPRWFGVLRACVTAYMVTTGVVYNLLLRGIELDGATLGWSNEILHVVGPLLLAIDWLFAPGRRPLPWSTIGIVVVFPIVWATYTMVRGPFVVDPTRAALTPGYEIGWYPYPFLEPSGPGGYGSVVVYIVLIAVIIGIAGAGIVAISRRGARRAAAA